MTKEEKKKLLKAINYLGNDRWNEGMDILLKLVGKEPIKMVGEPKNIIEIAQEKNE